MIVLGIVLGQSFLLWTHRRQAAGKTPLLALEVIDSPEERCAVFALFAVVALEAALNFTVPLYIQIVQGRSPHCNRDRDDAVQPDGVLLGDADRQFYDRLDAAPDRPLRLLAVHASRWSGSPSSCATTGARFLSCSASSCSASARARW